MGKKKLLRFLMCDYRGCSPPKDFWAAVQEIFAVLTAFVLLLDAHAGRQGGISSREML